MKHDELITNMRELLLRRRDELRRSLDDELDRLSGPDDMDESPGDEIISQVTESESSELAAIENALIQMREGTYGKCDDCNESIPLPRLEVLPYATKCIECQRKAEKNQSSSAGRQNWSRMMDQSDDDSGRDQREFAESE